MRLFYWNTKRLISIFITIAVISAGCDKAQNTIRKIHGDYTLQFYTANGADSMNLFKEKFGTNFSFYQEGTFGDEVCVISGPRNDGKEFQIKWTWEYLGYEDGFDVITSQVRVIETGTLDTTMGTGPFGANRHPRWHIVSIDRDEMELSCKTNCKYYLIKLEE
ncbi:MAG TPA: hypothetical protein PKI01_08415 [Bacteroidales bacterium]|nr:hypothetical protein [Bacteroidales bacterium]